MTGRGNCYDFLLHGSLPKAKPYTPPVGYFPYQIQKQPRASIPLPPSLPQSYPSFLFSSLPPSHHVSFLLSLLPFPPLLSFSLILPFTCIHLHTAWDSSFLDSVGQELVELDSVLQAYGQLYLGEEAKAEDIRERDGLTQLPKS